MRPSRIRSKLQNNQPILVPVLSFADPAVFELASLMGFDGIWLDLEHHAHSLETAATLMRAARVGQSDILARPAKEEWMRMGRLLEAGAQGIIYPRCDNAAEAREVVKWAKFPPLGRRGIDGGNADMPYCSMPVAQYLREANEETFIVIQIEDPAALEHVEEIISVEGVDVVMIGPGDYSSLSGFPGQTDHPQMVKAIERMAAAADRAGKHWGVPTWSSPDEAFRFLELGAKFLPHSADLLILKHGLERIQHDFAAQGFTFANQFVPSSAAVRPVNRPHVPLSTDRPPIIGTPAMP